jgi:hypothetical protein
MLIALFLGSLLLLFLGGEDRFVEMVEHSRDQVDEQIPESRAEPALKALDEIETIFSDYVQVIEEASVSLTEIHQEHATTTEDYVQVLIRVDEERMSMQDRFLTQREQLTELLTAEEWSRVFPAQ